MAAAAPLISVPKNLYKHFAVLTVGITFCVAIFADGENKQALAERTARHQVAKTQARAAQAARPQGLTDLRDSRGQVLNGNEDVGSPPASVPATTMFAADEIIEGDLAAATEPPPPPRRSRKMPAVLPPGMSETPGLSATPDPTEDKFPG